MGEGMIVREGHWCASVDAAIQLRTGCSSREKERPQTVEVHVDAWAPVNAVSNPHDIHDVVDYEQIFLAICRLEGMAHCECLESSILDLMDEVFGISVVTIVYISMRKPDIYGPRGTPGISLHLTREQWDQLRNSR